ncbi:double-strand break repair protein AddB [Haematospirillum jordaniae]|nr:double-strand break repair protein AddB [Haematospirillum jordaniae]
MHQDTGVTLRGPLLNIPARFPFADTLARGLLEETGSDPMQLATYTLLLPTRRAVRTLREAFLRQSNGKALLLPRLLPVADPDEITLLPLLSDTSATDDSTMDIRPPISPLHRQLLLTRLILAAPATGQACTPDRAALLASELAQLLDQVQTEGLGFDALKKLVPEDYAQHWQITLDFLSILTRHWPVILDSMGCLDPAEHRNRLLLARAHTWQTTPPSGPVLAAGITGSIPAVASLLATIATLPQGRVVLPGLDRNLDADSWEAIDESHPQYALKRLLDRLGKNRDAVHNWPCVESIRTAHPDRERLCSELMRPASTTHTWRHIKPLAEEAIKGITRLDCPSPREEALAIALLMRHTLSIPERTCALVTPDRDLARRVAADLTRWGITVDDSAGRPLTVTPPGAFLRLGADMVAQRFAPVPLLALLKHPLCSAGLDAAVFRDSVRRLELTVLRGVRPAPGIAGLRAAALASGAMDESLSTLLDALERCCADFTALMAEQNVPLHILLESHMRMAEALATTPDRPGPLWLWDADAGMAAASFAADLAEHAAVLGQIRPQAYPGLLDALMRGRTVRTRFGSHPRLDILGPMEARLHQADVMIVGSLNEDVWPPRPGADPWMSRPMRTAFGLPLPEQKVGHTAHDLVTVLGSPHVVLTRSLKAEGTPTVPSRWLLRLETVLSAVGLALPEPEHPWLKWAELFDRPEQMIPVRRPAPRPPVESRPRALSATRIETWMRDPYAIYACHILGLRPLDPLDAQPGPADYGTLVHRALEDFIKRFPHILPADPEAELLASGQKVFADTIARPSVQAFWWPRFERLAHWFAIQEQGRRTMIRETFVEISGSLDLGDFVLTAKADRIDLLEDGSLVIVDYKTGAPPSAREVAAGFSPQLPLEALIAHHGGFPGIPAGRTISSLLYWHLKGSANGGEERNACGHGMSPDTLAKQALEGLRGLVDAFSHPDTPYEARPHPGKAPAWSDWLHLARVREWAAAGDTDGGEA